MSENSGIVIGGCRIDRELGRGGAGTVYRATQLGIGRAVAVKLIPVGVDELGTAARFEREAHAAGALDHPHCLPVYAAGEQDGLLYLVMRLVDGPDLARMVSEHGPLAPADAVELMEQVASAVDHAHQAGLVHRDLKPANILIEPGPTGSRGIGHAYVSDFGLMRSLTDPGITQSGQWVGTPRFAAPEQMRGEEVGPTADIYALGGVLAAALGPEPPAPLAAVIERARAAAPGARFGTASAFADAARRALEGHSAPTALSDTVTRRRSTTAAAQGGGRSGRPRAALAGALGVIIALAVAAIAVVLVLDRRSPRLPARASAPATSSTTAASTTPASTTSPGGNVLSTPAFTATLPRGWTTATVAQRLDGYERTVVQNPTSSAEVFIDDSASPGQSLSAHAQSVETSAARTSGYQKVSFGTTAIDGASAVVWSFTLSGVADGQRVDVFREVGDQLFAVLGSSDSLSTSETTATGIAGSIRLR